MVSIRIVASYSELSQQGLGPKVLNKTNSHGVPYLSMLVSSIALLIAALLNYIFPNAIQLFIYVTTLSTVLFLVVWAMIIVAYLMYLKSILRHIKTVNLS